MERDFTSIVENSEHFPDEAESGFQYTVKIRQFGPNTILVMKILRSLEGRYVIHGMEGKILKILPKEGDFIWSGGSKIEAARLASEVRAAGGVVDIDYEQMKR